MSKQYYEEHREEIQAKFKEQYGANKEYYRAINLRCYHKHKEQRAAYYQANKARLNAQKGRHRLETVITYNGTRPNITSVHKSPYPENRECMHCHKPAIFLNWHHWDDVYPEDGLWLCPSCHRKLHGSLNKLASFLINKKA